MPHHEPRLPALVTIDEVATALRVHRSTVTRMSGAGKTLPEPLKFGGQFRYRAADIEALLVGA